MKVTGTDVTLVPIKYEADPLLVAEVSALFAYMPVVVPVVLVNVGAVVSAITVITYVPVLPTLSVTVNVVVPTGQLKLEAVVLVVELPVT